MNEDRIKALRRLIKAATLDNDLDLVQDLIAQLHAETEAMQVAAAREDPDAFIEYVFEDKHGQPLRQGPLHRQWQREIYHPEWNPDGSRRALIIAPRDHGKTTQIAVGRVLWELGKNPNLRIKIACQSDSKAMERLFEITDHLERNDRVKKVFPHLQPADRGDWTKHKIVVQRDLFSKDASIEALGITSTATGGRCDLLLADDIVDRRNAIQFPQIRETIKHAWKSDWTNLLEPDGRVVYICTLWHTADNSHELMNNPAYSVLAHAVNTSMTELEGYRVERGSNRTRIEWNEPLWEHWTTDALKDRRIEIGSIEFDRAFRNIALSGEIIVIDEATMIHYYDPFDAPEPDRLLYFQGYDLAIGRKQQNDFFAVCTVGLDLEAGRIYVVDAWHSKLSFTQQARAVIREFVQYEPEEQAIEVVSYQDSLVQYCDSLEGKFVDTNGQVVQQVVTRTVQGKGTRLEYEEIEYVDERGDRVHRVPQLPIVRMKPRLDKMSRLKAVTPYLERKQVMFHPKFDPKGTGFVKERGDLLGELTTFPLAGHDDLVDAFVNAVSRAARYLALRDDDGDDADDGPELDVGVRVIGV